MNGIAGALGLDLGTVAGPAWVTLAYVAVYYGFIGLLLRTKLRLARDYKERGVEFDRYFGQDRELLAADRVQLNMLEHMPVFLVLLWLHAFVVAGLETTILGGIYTATRALYPFLLGGRMGRNISIRVVPCTFVGYAILVVLAVRIAMQL